MPRTNKKTEKPTKGAAKAPRASKKAAAVKEEEVVAAAAPAPAPAVEEVAAPAVDNQVIAPSVSDDFAVVLDQLTAARNQIRQLTTMVKALQKRTERDMKAAQKTNRKRRVNGERAPSGFLKPAIISDDLANFLGRPKGSVMSRKDVTKEIDTYVKAHNLQDPANRRTILPDKKLRSLFNIGKSDSLTYFNLQHYMKTHFTPDASSSKASAAETTATA